MLKDKQPLIFLERRYGGTCPFQEKLKNAEKKHGKHPSQKPLEVGNRLVLGCTNPEDKVLDPFSGSGSFLVSAKMHGRHYLGIDQDAEYVKLAKARLTGTSLQDSLGI